MKSKILINLFVIMTSLSLSLSSCKKDIVQKTNNVAETISNYFALKDLNNNNGSISFNSTKTFGSNAKAVYQISSVLFDKEGNQIKQGDLKINDLVIKATEQGIISTDIKVSNEIGSLFGKELVIQALKENPGLNPRGGDVLINSNIRLPSEVKVTSPTATSTIQSISRNETIRWIPDPNNTKKMFIAIEFDPNKNDNKSFKNNKASANYVEVDDTGSYQLRPNDFKGIPNGSLISIYVTRGNYTKTVSTSGREQYAVFGYSMARNQFKS